MRKTAAIAVFCLCATVFAQQAKWIWSAESRYAWNETVLFRYDFDLPADAESGRIGISGDDKYKVYVNGTLVRDMTTFRCQPVNAKGLLKKGRNCIAAAVTNVVSQAGFLFFAEFTVNGETRCIATDGTWQCTIAPKGWEASLEWTRPDRPAPKWRKAKVVRPVTEKHTWRDRIVLQEFMTAEAYARFAEAQIHDSRKMRELVAAARPRLQMLTAPKEVRFVRHANLPFLRVDGRDLAFPMYNALYLDLTKPEHFFRLQRFYDAGFRIFFVGIRMEQFWREDGTVDLAPTVQQLEALLAAAPDAVITFNFRLFPPRWYMEKHPDELVGYGSNATLVPAGDELKTAIMRPSLASKRWMQDAGQALTAFIAQLERRTPAARRIAMYHVSYGIYGEWHYFGMVKDLPDTSRPMQEKFTRYLKRKYQTDAALQAAWKDRAVTLATAAIPSAAQRLARRDGELFVPGSDCRVIDFNDCMGEAVQECQAFFNNTVRQAAGRPVLVGNYSGYFFGMQYPSFGWHCRTPQTLRSQDVDYHSSPYAYAYRSAGASGLPRGVFESYALNGKVALMESDVRTHLAADGNTTSQSQAETDGMMVRDFCNAITRGAAMWFFDFQFGWYDHPRYLAAFARMIRLWQSRPDATRVSEVCMVCDFDSVKYHTAEANPNAFSVKLVSDLSQQMFKAGAPFDTVYIEDLALPAATPYKLYVFPNLVHLTEEKAAVVERLLRRGATVVFLCGPQAVARWGSHPKVRCVGNAIGGRALHRLYQESGVHCYTEDPDACLYVCRGLVGFHRVAGGPAEITLPKMPASIRQIFPVEKELPPARIIRFNHPHAGTSLFQVKFE